MTRLSTFIIEIAGEPVIINRSDYDENIHVLHASQSVTEVNDFVLARNIASGGSVSFIPSLQDLSFSNAEGQTYANQTGEAVKVGPLVLFNLHLVMTSLGTLSTTQFVNIAGFPFKIVGDHSVSFNGQSVGLGLSSDFTITGRFDSASQTMRLMKMSTGAGHSSMTIAEISDNGDVKMSGHYKTDP